MLLDSNIIIYSAEEQYAFLREYVKAQENVVSAVSKIEVLGFYDLTPRDRTYFEAVFQFMNLLPVSSEVIDLATLLRQKNKLSLGDSIIAATALFYDQTLVTRNIKDFKNLQGLHYINPLNS
ncbi:type II toxin-antitoxin system VapC family toxin [Catalinimonas niigatensis]|uniref:type II toxin-antitoxin system VapC family toxin n=1 Tax=Catalinimonas niigatensis TaxID=1397264 RepID=UPI0026671423|nr:type II toxin-antitoxin system VapC family toxin [Catalinimonas niigatensis]WPP51825.1 type II toxin-antitoxin system VapC family toxin [Catalinimonas niigatensis]